MQNWAPQYTNMQGRSAPINYQCSQSGSAISRLAGQQTHGMPVGNNYAVMGRNVSTTSAAMQQGNVGLPQGRAFPSQQMAWQSQPPQNQMMPCAGGDVHSPSGHVASPNQQDKVKMKGAPIPSRSPGLRVLTGRVGKVLIFLLKLLQFLVFNDKSCYNLLGEGVGWPGSALPCALQGARHSRDRNRILWRSSQVEQQEQALRADW